MYVKRSLMVTTLLAAGGCLLAGCYDPREVEAFLQRPRTAVSGVEYRVLPPDMLAVSSTYVPEINGVNVRVRPDGKINLPLLGELYVAGKTPKEIEALIRQGAGAYYEQVDANVRVVGYNSQKLYVFGEVLRPGPRAWTGCDPVLDVLATAQPTELAWAERIVIVRGSEPTQGGYGTPEGTRKYRAIGVHPQPADRPRKRLTLNLMAMVKSGDMANNVLLMPNDIVYVQPNPFAHAGLFMRKVLFPVRPVLETLRVPANVEAAGNPGDNP